MMRPFLFVVLFLSPTLVAADLDLKSDWLDQARLRNSAVKYAPASDWIKITTAEDAAGAVDGIKDGKWGFHTSQNDTPPWWHVDLGSVQPLAKVVVYNRCDFASRTTALEILFSDDGKQWKQAWKNDGKLFLGFTDKKPLVVDLNGAPARFVRLQIPPRIYFHLDEVEIYGTQTGDKNIALHKPADQSSVSQWSARKLAKPVAARPNNPNFDDTEYPLAVTIERGRKLAAVLKQQGVLVDEALQKLDKIDSELHSPAASSRHPREFYLDIRQVNRSLTLANPILDFDKILFVKRAPGTFSHMSDQYYSWWQRAGGGVYLLENFKTASPTTRCLTSSFPEGTFLAPDISYDGKKVLFAYSRYYPDRSGLKNKTDKCAQPEDSFFHIFEMNVDGTGLRQITHGRYEDMFARYLPDGDIVFLSTRRGTSLQVGKFTAEATRKETLPDSYVRCGGDNARPVSIYTLHTMAADGTNMRAISAFESFEWDPSISNDGRIFYARWDYVDRFNGPYMKLWSTNPDGTNPSIVWGNYTKNPLCIFEARTVPGTSKILATASAHHSITGGSLIMLDVSNGILDGDSQLTRLSPEVCFPETEGWPATYYTNPWPLSEQFYLCAWSNQPINSQGKGNPLNALGIYSYDCFGNLELLYRDKDITSMYPIPVKPRFTPPVRPSVVDWDGPQVGTMVLQDIYRGLDGVERGSIKSLRIVAMPVKIQPHINNPKIGVTVEDPGKAVLGTVPVEADGSAHFLLPSGVSVFFQALDEQGRAVQTMRSLTYIQPGQNMSCIGCHEPRTETPLPAMRPLAMQRPASRLRPGPDGSWVLRFDKLVQPILDARCVSCHNPQSKEQHISKLDLSPAAAYNALVAWGNPSLTSLVKQAHGEGRSHVGKGPSIVNPLLGLFDRKDGHYQTKLTPSDRQRLITWMDTYAQFQGYFGPTQEEDLLKFRERIRNLLDESASPTAQR